MSQRKPWYFSIVVTAALSSAVAALAQGMAHLYLPSVARNFGGLTATATVPVPTLTPGPSGSCGAFVNAAGLTGSFSLAYTGSGHHAFSGEDLIASVSRSFTAVVTFGNRLVEDDGNGHIASVQWKVVAVNQPVVVINDAYTSVFSGPPPVTYNTSAVGGTLNPTYTQGYLNLDAVTCLYALTLWPWADQTVGASATVDSVFRFWAYFVPVRSTTALAESISVRAYHNAQYSGSERPSYEANFASSNTVTGNPISGQLFRAQSGSVAAGGPLNEAATASWSFSPVP